MRFTKDIIIGEIPTASNSSYSALFQVDGQVRKRTLGSIITQNTDDYLSGISVAFPTSIFNIADSSITPSQPNLVVSLKNQLAGTVFAAPETLNGTPSFRKLADVDLDQTTVAFQDDIPTNYITTNTNQTGLSGNKTTSGAWTYRGTNSTPITIERTNVPNTNIRYINQGSSIYTGATNGADDGANNVFAIGGSADLNNVSGRWMWVDNTGNLTAKSDVNPLSGWVNGQVASYPSHSIRLGGSGRDYMDFFEYGGLWNFYRSRTTGNTLIASISNSKISSNGYEIYGRTDSDIVLAGGGHRPVSDFALAGSLGNYLPLSGGTMNTDALINFNYQGGLSHAGQTRLRFSTGSNIFSANTTTGIAFYFRPQGDLITTGQVTIHGDGQINTANHGNSSQWKQAYDWGDFREFGLGNSTVNSLGWNAINFNDINSGNAHPTSFVMSNGNTGTLGQPAGFSYSYGIHFNISSSVFGDLVISHGTTNRMAFRSRLNDWSEVWHADNFNPSDYSTQTLSSSTSNIISGSTVQRAALTGDVTASQNSNVTTIANNAVTTAKIINSAVTHAKYQNIATKRILGRGATGTGNVQELTLGTGLSLSNAGVLSASQDSIFAYSPQGGLYTTDWSSTALGLHSVAIGYTSVVTASSSISIGKGVFTGGAMSQNIGFSSNVNKALSSNFGSYNLNNAELGNTFGQGLINRGMGTTVIGKYNQIIDHQENMDVDDKTAAIQFGVGKDELTRRNAITIYNDRRADYDPNRDDSTWNRHTIPDIKWIQENISGGGGGGGNMNYAYIDPDNTHAFGTDMANGLLVPSSYIAEAGYTEKTFDMITVRALVGGGYVHISPSTIFSEIAVSINDDILVTQGCIKTGTTGNAFEAGSAFNLILIYYTQDNNFELLWVPTAGIIDLRHRADYVVNVIGQLFDHNGEDYFNVNPQIV